MIRLKQILLEQLGEFNPEEFNSPGKIMRQITSNKDLLNYIAGQFGESIQNYNTMTGANSWVWWLNSGKVLKITSNSDEANAAAYFRKLPKVPHIISYYDIRELLVNGEDHELWATITDGVRTLNVIESKWWTKLSEGYDFWEGYIDTEEIWNAFGSEDYPPEAFEFARKILNQRNGILRDAKKFEIKTYEAHSGNVGFDVYGQFVIFDVWSHMSMTPKGIANRMTKPIDLAKAFPPKYTTDGIDTPGDPNM